MSRITHVLAPFTFALATGCVVGTADPADPSGPPDSEEVVDEELVAARPKPQQPPNDRFDFEVRSRHDGGVGEVGVVGIFPYVRNLGDKGFDPDAKWLDGDRLAYACGWTFMEYEGELVARVFFDRIQYGVVLDERMREGSLDWDGQPGNGQAQTDHPTACNEKYPAVAYEPLTGDPGPVPVITLSDAQDGHTLEVRDYNNVVTGSGIKFRIAETTPQLTKVVMYQDDLPVAVSYYESLSSSIVKTTNAD